MALQGIQLVGEVWMKNQDESMGGVPTYTIAGASKCPPNEPSSPEVVCNGQHCCYQANTARLCASQARYTTPVHCWAVTRRSFFRWTIAAGPFVS
ncbi:hypothetical protein GSI_05399 [Ganoderma sinense ZZ0214-1]|uniref:Uncharacterized protein n=1 Tax=Ganoderma sinense ZZ0214-1 TaxID=1077348 RepID=A0A2G8SFZ8_9APHY|nr:hypothetical protein GSI_05399 [Ganoderma sinense ZZ0214-1]